MCNAFCGLNLAGHALGRNGVGFGWLYADPGAADLAGLLAGDYAVSPVDGSAPGVAAQAMPVPDRRAGA